MSCLLQHVLLSPPTVHEENCFCVPGIAALEVDAPDATAHRFFNFLVRNKWRSKKDIRHLADTPVLLLSSLKVPSLPHRRPTDIVASYHC